VTKITEVKKQLINKKVDSQAKAYRLISWRIVRLQFIRCFRLIGYFSVHAIIVIAPFAPDLN
jgi:hypothetical protein